MCFAERYAWFHGRPPVSIFIDCSRSGRWWSRNQSSRKSVGLRVNTVIDGGSYLLIEKQSQFVNNVNM